MKLFVLISFGLIGSLLLVVLPLAGQRGNHFSYGEKGNYQGELSIKYSLIAKNLEKNGILESPLMESIGYQVDLNRFTNTLLSLRFSGLKFQSPSHKNNFYLEITSGDQQKSQIEPLQLLSLTPNNIILGERGGGQERTTGRIEYRFSKIPRKPLENNVTLSAAIVDAESGERYPIEFSFPYVLIPKGSSWAASDTAFDAQAVMVKTKEVAAAADKAVLSADTLVNPVPTSAQKPEPGTKLWLTANAIQISGLQEDSGSLFLEIAGEDNSSQILFRKELATDSLISIPFDSTRLAAGRYLFSVVDSTGHPIIVPQAFGFGKTGWSHKVWWAACIAGLILLGWFAYWLYKKYIYF